MTAKKNKWAKKKAAQKAASSSSASAEVDHIASGSRSESSTPMDGESSPVTEEGTSNVEVPLKSSTSGEEHAEEKIDQSVRADQLKEEGNAAFREKRFGTAIDLYSQAIDLRPSEPTYLTNRAASYMALKRFKPALADCQQAAALQASNPSPKTLVRLARCQLSLGSPNPALSVLRQALAVDPANAAAKQLQVKVLELEAHLREFERARTQKRWSLARLALDKCLQSIDGEAGDVPSEWRCWQIEIELARGDFDAANVTAHDALRLDSNSADVLALRGLVLFLSANLSGALQHAISALRLDPDNARAKSLRLRVKAVERLKEEGNSFFKQGNWKDAIGKYSEALDVVGESEEEGKGGQMRATLLSNRATALVKLDKHDEALEDITVSLDLYPSSFKALRTRARIHMHLEKFDAAIADFTTAIEQAEAEGSTADERALKAELKKAEAALKRSKTKDYYKILGVARDCSVTEIKKAYRRESLKHHPDKGGDEEKFKLVVEAHTVLSDPTRRQRYDLGDDEDGSMGSPGGMGGFGGMDPNDFANMFMNFSGRGGGGGFHFHHG